MEGRKVIVVVAILAVFALVLSVGEITGFAAANERSPEGMRAQVFKSIYETIDKLREQDLYACCIEPPCTMCFLKGTEHEYTFDGKYCNCDGLIAEGKDPCPQCMRELCG